MRFPANTNDEGGVDQKMDGRDGDAQTEGGQQDEKRSLSVSPSPLQSLSSRRSPARSTAVDPHPPFCSSPAPKFRSQPAVAAVSADKWRDDVSKRRAGAVQARFHRAEVDPGNLGDLFVRLSLELSKDEDLTMVGRQL